MLLIVAKLLLNRTDQGLPGNSPAQILEGRFALGVGPQVKEQIATEQNQNAHVGESELAADGHMVEVVAGGSKGKGKLRI
jgi:hypothetical protein